MMCMKESSIPRLSIWVSSGSPSKWFLPLPLAVIIWRIVSVYASYQFAFHFKNKPPKARRWSHKTAGKLSRQSQRQETKNPTEIPLMKGIKTSLQVASIITVFLQKHLLNTSGNHVANGLKPNRELSFVAVPLLSTRCWPQDRANPHGAPAWSSLAPWRSSIIGRGFCSCCQQAAGGTSSQAKLSHRALPWDLAYWGRAGLALFQTAVC